MPPIHLDPDTHAQAGWQRFSSYQFAAQDHLCPVQMAELTQILPWYPLGFVPAQDNPQGPASRRHLIALLGARPGHNLYLNPQGTWQAPYIPAHFRGYPFQLDAQGQLLFNTASGLFCETAPDAGSAFYTPEGEPSPVLQQLQRFLSQCRQGLGLTQTLVQQLVQYSVLEPWPIQFLVNNTSHNGKHSQQTFNLQGIERINEAGLKALPPEHLAQLALSGALGLAYAQLFSQARLADLNVRLNKAQAPTAPSDHLELNSLFGEDHETLRFD